MSDLTPRSEDQLREQLEREILSRRRDFLLRTLVASCAVPLITSFAARDLVRAASCPGVGNCGKSEWARSM